MKGRVLIIEDDRSMCEMLYDTLQRRGFSVIWRLRAEEGLELLAEQDFDVLLSDLRLPGVTGLELCARMNANRPDLPVVVFTAFGSMEAAVAALRAGAFDFVTKPVDNDLLALTLERAVKHRELQEQVRVLRETVRRSQPFEEMLGESRGLREINDQIARVADLETTLLILGESGTGKELAARALHRRSRRSDGPFVAVNCAALPENLLENELFGHVKGAFTDARDEHQGLFQQARGGTLFLDEIGEMPLALQPKLLRALEERSVRPLGATREISVDARIVAATNQDLEAAVAEGRFREDLYYRLHVIPLELPPLRTRGADILLLAQKFVEEVAAGIGKKVTGLSQAAAERLLAYRWPGNIRELRNVIERAVILARYEKLSVDDLPEKIRTYHKVSPEVGAPEEGDILSLEEVERRHILKVLQMTQGHRSEAARLLGLDRKTLYRKLSRYDMQ